MVEGHLYSFALQDFREARRRAALEAILARLTGKPADLLSYGDVRSKLHARESATRVLKEIPLDAIVGSVGRYQDFSRSFLPRQDSDQDRWARVKAAMTDLRGVPPIEVYQIDQVYFVLDGNHRVSVARQLGLDCIQAYATPVQTKVPLTPDVQPDELILKAEYIEFLERTHLDELRPDADLSVTVPGQYRVLEEHIAVHRYYMGLEQRREIPYREAVAHWYDEVYQPVVQVIRERGILRDFPGRTEADLYLWLAEHRAALEAELEWNVSPEAAVADLAARHSPRPRRVIARVGEKVLDAVRAGTLAAGPRPGEWRRERLTDSRSDRLFADILVAINGDEAGWRALDQAIEIARCEEGTLQGLHVVPSEAQKEGQKAQAVQAEFDRRCQAAGIPGHLALEVGEVSPTLCERARWTDLVVLSLNHPPVPQPLARLGSGLSAIIRRCPRPILATPAALPPLKVCAALERVLLAYDGSPKSDEALFVAAYVASRWSASLVVVTAIEPGRTTADTMDRAREYLGAQGVSATYRKAGKPVAETILGAAQDQESDLIVMGGYGHNPVLELVLGSAVDQVLRESRRPLLICR